MGEPREITGIHDISGTIYREVGPSFKKVRGSDLKVDGAGIRRIWHRGARKTELLTWESESLAIVRQELTFQNLLIETNQTGIVRTGRIPQDEGEGQPQTVAFTPNPDPNILRKCAMLLAEMKDRDAYQHHLLETLNATLESIGHAALNVMHTGPHNQDRNHHDPAGGIVISPSINSDDDLSAKPRQNAYWLRLAIGFTAAILLLIFLSR